MYENSLLGTLICLLAVFFRYTSYQYVISFSSFSSSILTFKNINLKILIFVQDWIALETYCNDAVICHTLHSCSHASYL